MDIKKRRLELGLTQKQLADRAGMVYQQIQKLETGERDIEKMTLKNALSLAKALKVKPEDLIKD